MNEYSASVTGSPESLKTYKCLRWEQRQIVSDDVLALHTYVMSVAPEMLDEYFDTHESFCAEYSDELVELRIAPIPDWVTKLERYDVPLTKFYGSPE